MSKVTIQGDASGTGIFTIASPNSNTDRTLTLPDEVGTVLTDRVIGVNASAPDDSVVVDASGNVGIGTSIPAVALDLTSGVTGETRNSIRLGYGRPANPTDAIHQIQASSDNLYIKADAANTITSNIIFQNDGTERARIDSSGNLLVGTTSSFGSGVGFCGFANGTAALRLKRGADYGATARFYNFGGSEVGSITVNASSTSYVTSSDYRLKEDWVAVADASTRVNALKPVNFAWKADGTRVDGFLAHELAEVVPEAVTGEKDAVELVDIKDEDGNVTGQEERPVYQGIDQSKLVPLLTAALQEALAKIEDLTARVVALEGQP